jgi:sugar lactone lactonase YvrE
VSYPAHTIIDGNTMYIAEFTGNKIVKVDMTSPNPTPVDFVTNLAGPFSLLLDGDILYYTDPMIGIIAKVDITDSIPTPVTILTDLMNPLGLLLDGNEMYVTEADLNRILKFDITQSNPTTSIIASSLHHPESMLLYGSELYFTEYFGNRISKVDLSAVNPTVQTVASNVYGVVDLELIGNTLYASAGSDIYQLDITQTNPTVTTLVPANNCVGLSFDGNNLYVSEMFLNKVSMISLNIVSTNEPKAPIWKLFPNPADETIRIEGLEKSQRYTIINVLGQQVKEGIIQLNGQINITDLSNGMFWLRMEDGSVREFVKH